MDSVKESSHFCEQESLEIYVRAEGQNASPEPFEGNGAKQAQVIVLRG